MRAGYVEHRIREASRSLDPFPHIIVENLLAPDDLAAVRDNFPPVEAFEVKGRGAKLELDILETRPAFETLTQVCQSVLLDLRNLIRTTATPLLVDLFDQELRQKYVWLLGDELAAEMMERGFTTTDGRLMGRGLGYRLEPHLDSAHFGITCLLYFATANTAADGALCLYKPERPPAVIHASTYYPEKDEGISASLAVEIPVRENRFVAFLNGPLSLHGFARPPIGSVATPWRFVYQCHVVPQGFDIRRIAHRLGEGKELARWMSILTSS